MALSTQSTLSVPARGDPRWNCPPRSMGSMVCSVTVSSKRETPIASVVRTVTMDGLTPKGSDFALPLPTASNASVAPSITAGDAGHRLSVRQGRHQHRAVMDYRQKFGSAKDATVTADKDGGSTWEKFPDGSAAMSTAEDAVSRSPSRPLRSGDLAADFSLVNAGEPSESRVGPS